MTPGDLDRAVALLGQGRVVAAATETYFGLLADARSPEAIERVFALKERDEGKAVALLLPSRALWSSLVREIPPIAEHLANRFWPGPLTIALPARRGLDPRLLARGTIAVRLAGPSDASEIARAFGAPLTATSANVARGVPCKTTADVERCFADAGSAGDLVVVPGEAPGGAPSTLVSVEGGTVKILRAGQITEDEIRQARR
jgi:L-threonylcarbamoyladenylate synthase